MLRLHSSSYVLLLSGSVLLTACSSGAPGEAAADENAAVDGVDTASASTEILSWSQIALDAVWRDHTPPAKGDNRVAFEQAGPTRTSRALAIVYIAIADAVQSIAGTYDTYTDMPVDSRANMSAAIAVAAHDTLSSLYPSQKPSFDLALTHDLAKNTSKTKDAGVKRGALAASNVLSLRSGDGAERAEPKYSDMGLPTGVGQWAPDVASPNPTAVGGYWMLVTPFALFSADQYRAAAPHPVGSAEYEADFEDTRMVGGDGHGTPTRRTKTQTEIGIYWGYDGAPKIGTPPRLYNAIALEIAHDAGLYNQPAELSRMLALVNAAMADAGICAWDSKYFYNLWRPTNAIRAAGGSDADWTALGAMESNTTSPDFTPPFPAYPSGHATFGGALFQVLRRLVGDRGFTFVSDEFNGVTAGSDGHPRARLPRTFKTLTAAEAENARSRIYLGVHWQQDAVSGISMGNEIADFVVDNFYTPRGGNHDVAHAKRSK